MRKLRAYLELVRIPGVFTAQSDIVAGVLIAAGGGFHPGDLVYLLCASSCFLSAGMALNDFFDAEVDRKERPGRPIPSGRVTRSSALLLGLALLGAGIFLAGRVGGASFGIGLLLAISILSYDGWLKKHPWLGPVNMGGCRYLNLLLGLSVAPLSPWMFFLPLIHWIFIFGVTVLSRQEAGGAKPGAGIWITAGSILSAWVLYGIFFTSGILPRTAGFFLFSAWAFFAVWIVLRLLNQSTPADIQKTMKRLLLSIVVIGGILVTGIRPVYWGLFVWILLVPAVVISKRFYVT